jgi:AraC-like DNA-binding protein
MEFRYLEKKKYHPLIDHFYQLKIQKEDLPFSSLILPLGQININYVVSDVKQILKQKDQKEIHYDGFMVTGQFYGCYKVSILEESYNFGFGLKPTSLYKLIGKDISKFKNKHIPLSYLGKKINIELKSIFEENIDNIDNFIKAVYLYFDNFPYKEDKNVFFLDKAIQLIEEKEGLLKVKDILELTPFSQKNLELQFKKVIGLTPGKYIKQYRFMKLMRKYESKQISLTDLKYMFNYYDGSHFSKDFHFFMNQSPKSYFKNDYPLLRSYLKE